MCNAAISVRTRDLFTIITVNGLDIYFHRLTGAIDGVGFSQNADCSLQESSSQAEQSNDPELQRVD